MKRWLKLLFPLITTTTVVSFTVSCNKINDETNLKKQETILQILSETPLVKQQPVIRFLNKNDQLSEYTAEALDCMHLISGATITDSKTNLTLDSTVEEVIQLPGNSFADMKVSWKIRNDSSNVNYISRYTITGFKQIPANHYHYIRSKEIVPNNVCLLKYNGISSVNEDNLLVNEDYPQQTILTTKQNIKQYLLEVSQKFIFKNTDTFIEELLTSSISTVISKFEQTQSVTKKDLKIIFLTLVGSQLESAYENSRIKSNILNNYFDKISAYILKHNQVLNNEHKQILFALFLKIYSALELEINFSALNEQMFETWMNLKIFNLLKAQNNPNYVSFK